MRVMKFLPERCVVCSVNCSTCVRFRRLYFCDALDGGVRRECRTWLGMRTALLNSSSSTSSHSSSKDGRSDAQYPLRGAWSISESIRWRSDVLAKPNDQMQPPGFWAKYTCCPIVVETLGIFKEDACLLLSDHGRQISARFHLCFGDFLLCSVSRKYSHQSET